MNIFIVLLGLRSIAKNESNVNFPKTKGKERTVPDNLKLVIGL